MSLYGISDLHLALGMNKPMDIFGSHWDDHSEKLKANWLDTVKIADTVIIPGDISWGMTLAEAKPDLEFLHKLPGTKIISKGNHDYWWSTVKKIEDFIGENDFNTIKVLKNNYFYPDDNTLLCGTRGWLLPGDGNFGQNDTGIFLREVGRLKISLGNAVKSGKKYDRIVVALHYPPLLSGIESSPFTELMQSFGVTCCLYGHVHHKGMGRCLEGVIGGINYINISADKIAFKPLLV